MPIERVAVLADIHGNLPALEAVLLDVERARPDRIVLNGDLVDGPLPGETFRRLEALGPSAIWLRGNGDRWLGESYAGRFTHHDAETDAMLRWAADRLTAAERARLADLPLCATLEVAGLGTVGFCHATARSDNEMVLVDSDLAQTAAAFDALAGDVVVLGHCHMPFDRLFDRRRFVNAGSVGMAYGHSGASWLLLGPEVTLKRTPYDVEAAAARMRQGGMPGIESFIDTYVRHTPSDAEALAAYHAIRKRQRSEGFVEASPKPE